MKDVFMNCPFCDGECGWCDEMTGDGHQCHQIKCSQCTTIFDIATKDEAINNLESFSELKAELLILFNQRH